MPELPEVETIARDLQKTVLLKKIQHVQVNDPFIIKKITPAQYVKLLHGSSVTQVFRRGKALVIELSNQLFWVIQPMMTGQCVYFYPKEQRNFLKETRVIVEFADGGALFYNDQRRFGHVQIVRDLSAIHYFQILGPEPLTADFNPEYLLARLKKTARPIKNVLLDHTVVAGIGNIYASEILFRAKVSPERFGNSITLKEAIKIYQYSVEVLEEAIKMRGSSMRNYRDGRGQKGEFNQLIRVYARENQPCMTCQSPIIRINQSGRSSFYCQHCQK